ncbi:MAG: hypothetical protein HY270_20265 [Deltaproteobacteria bacterium]|nr:hypothetical protein [Deltaproteobacteria bacterium]
MQRAANNFLVRATHLCGSWRVLATIVWFVAAAAPARAATTWYVGNDGNDTFFPSCGTKVLPCRSVGQAIAMAAAGDTIIVGPGVYGDLDGSGVLGDFPGEDAATGGCNCMINVNKQLTILSRDGAYLTVLDAGGLRGRTVDIQASQTVFGKPSKGFTMRNGGTGIGLFTDPAVQKVKVQGNVASGNATGFNISGNGAGGNSVLAADNVAILNGVAFFLSGSTNLLQRNRALFNNEGFVVGGDAHKVTQNIAIGNSLAGFEIDVQAGALNPVADFSKNAALANINRGIEVVAAPGLGSNATVVIKKNNMFGNGDSVDNCGLFINNGDASASLTVTAKSNFWGMSTGIGVNPADSAGGACTTTAGGTVTLDTSSPAAKELGVAQKPLK